MKKDSNIHVDGYLIYNGEKIDLKINTEQMLEQGSTAISAAEDINQFTSTVENQYLLLEFFLLNNHIEFNSVEQFKNVEKYSEYLYGLLCDMGYVILQEVKAIENDEENTRWTLSTKAKDRYASVEKTNFIHFPQDLSKLDASTIEYLNQHHDEYENQSYTYLYMEKAKGNTYKAVRVYSMNHFYNELEKVDKKIR